MTRFIEEYEAEPEIKGNDFELPLERIGKRYSGNARQLNQEHVIELKNSIKTLGFTSAITVDNKYRLICGAHRVAALRELFHEKWNGQDEGGGCFDFKKLPCVIAPFDSEDDPSRALLMELGENVTRKDFSQEEMDRSIAKLLDSGYEFGGGRNKGGKESISMVIQRLFKYDESKASRILKSYRERKGINKFLSKDDANDSSVIAPIPTQPHPSTPKLKTKLSLTPVVKIQKILVDVESALASATEEERAMHKATLSETLSTIIDQATRLQSQCA